MSIRSLATTLGLSITTVSRALAGYSDVAAATDGRVQREAARSGYRPNDVARRLRTERSGTIGMVIPFEQGTFDQFVLTTLGVGGPLLSRASLDLALMSAGPGKAETHAYRHLIEHHRLDGTLLARRLHDDPRIGYLLEQRVPVIAHERSGTSHTFASSDIDGETAFAAGYSDWLPRLLARRSDGPAPKKIRRAGGRHANGGRHVQEARDAEWRDTPRPPGYGSSCR